MDGVIYAKRERVCYRCAFPGKVVEITFRLPILKREGRYRAQEGEEGYGLHNRQCSIFVSRF